MSALRGRFDALLAGRRDVVVALGLYVGFALVYGDYHVVGDGLDYFSFDQRLFGDSASGSGYNFGTGLLNAPFYALGKLAQTVAGSHAAGHSLTQASITFASIFYVVVAGALAAWILGRLGFLRFRGVAVGAAVFGTPVWYYGSFSPSYTHAADAAVFSAVAVSLYVVWAQRRPQFRPWLGAALGLAIAIRPYNAALALAVVGALALTRRIRDAAIVAASATLSFAALLAIPLALGTGLLTRADGSRIGSQDFLFAPLNPLRMLFTEHRGLFVWTPVALIGVVGAIAAGRRSPAASYVRVLLACSLLLLLTYVTFARWDGGWSFSMRYLASPVALYAVGLGRVFAVQVPARRIAALAVVGLLTCWSVFLGMSHAFGASIPDGAFGVARNHSPGDFAHKAWAYARIRHL